MRKKPFYFREAKKGDLLLLIALLEDDQLGQTRENSTSVTLYEKAFHAIEKDPNSMILVAVTEDNRELLGCVQISYLPNLTFQGSWRAQLEGIRIHSLHRGQGLGKKLLEEAIALSKKRGCKIVQLTTNKKRIEAISFYKQLGFADTHIGMKLYTDVEEKDS